MGMKDYDGAKRLIDIIKINAENLQSDLNHLNHKITVERIELILKTLVIIKECSETLGRMIAQEFEQ